MRAHIATSTWLKFRAVAIWTGRRGFSRHGASEMFGVATAGAFTAVFPGHVLIEENHIGRWCPCKLSLTTQEGHRLHAVSGDAEMMARVSFLERLNDQLDISGTVID